MRLQQTPAFLFPHTHKRMHEAVPVFRLRYQPKTGKNVYDYLQMHVHKMTQAAQHGRINEFMDEVILFSNQFGLQIPRALLEGMTDMRKFDVVSRSYIIGVFS